MNTLKIRIQKIIIFVEENVEMQDMLEIEDAVSH